MYKLSEDEYEYLRLNPKENYRFVVETRAGSLTYDTFISLDDALNFVFKLCRDYDIYMMEEIQIYDKVSRLCFKPSNVRMFMRDFGNEVKEEAEILDTVCTR